VFHFRCPYCQGVIQSMEGQMGMGVICPYCKASIIVPTLNGPVNNFNQVPTRKETSTASLVLGIIGFLAWLIPLFGLPVSITGLVLGIKKHYTLGIVLNVIGLMLTVANAAIGAYMGMTGQMF